MAAPTDSLDLSTIASQLGAYYREFYETIHNNLETGLFEGPNSLEDRWTLVTDITDQLVLTEDVYKDYIHQFVPTSATTFNPTAGVVTPKARILQPKDYAGDLQFLDKEIERTFLMYRARMKQLDRTDSPQKTQTFIEYLFWEGIIAKGQNTLRRAIYLATYTPTAPYAWNKICNGVKKLLADEITAGTLVAGTVTSPTISNITGFVETEFDKLGTEVKTAPDVVVELSPAMYSLWVRRNSADLKRSDNYDSASQNSIYGYPNARVVQEPTFAGNEIFISRKSNKLVGFKKRPGTSNWEFQRFERVTKAMVNGTIEPQLVSVNSDSTNKNVAYAY